MKSGGTIGALENTGVAAHAHAHVSFDIYSPDDDCAQERTAVVSNAPAGHVIGLNAGTYHVVCH